MTYQAQLFQCCREGDLQKAQFLHEEKDVDLNLRDIWDSSPLYYACLCGHFELVEYLLQNGAKCVENSFDGERCLYGALTNDIKNLIKNWKQVHTRGLRRERHYDMMRSLLDKGSFYDVIMNVHGRQFKVHRYILSARSEYFADAFSNKWKNVDEVNISHHAVTADAFACLLQYLYTGRMDIQCDMVGQVKRLAKNCRLDLLHQEIIKVELRVDELVRLKPQMKKRVKVFSIEGEVCMSVFRDDLRKLVDHVIPPSLHDWVEDGILPFTKMWRETLLFPDVCFNIDNHLFLGHKAIFCACSDYFTALFEDHFLENSFHSGTRVLPMITLTHISPQIFKNVVVSMYSDEVEFTSMDTAYETMCTSHMLLFHGLTRRCGQILGQHLDESNLFPLLEVARNFDLPKLEDMCAMYMAKTLDKMVDNEEFAELVENDAAKIKDREETDSIPIVDDIRYHLTSSVQNYSQMEEANFKLSALNALLSRLGIDC
uniref:ankyrin repeat and BTB/POZ domain-containing protein 1 isoform X1 n=1 Tax=Ciona intestinalis TaxID=7719 RepID=UPI0000523EB8|nr:ankyrin repeat and BTB/POZ domain-containing protein 1 isoform X1 [Ciona intestinalis]|eukprot:XP_002119669.3 ankyrin repeat and BTB/POZ domain-containing protein 1 isoform X1 [Ciona intestinalis]